MAPKKKAKLEVPLWQWQGDDGKWSPYASKDCQTIEALYQTSQAKTGETSDLTFNEGYSTIYAFDFVAMTQTNKDSKKVRTIQRLTPTNEIQWEWRDDSGLFVPFYDEDIATIEKFCNEVGVDTGKEVKTKALSFNKGYDSWYVFTFMSGPKGADGTSNVVVGSQLNKDSGKRRDIRRVLKKPAWDTAGFGIAGMKLPDLPPPAAVAEEPAKPTTTAKKADSASARGAQATDDKADKADSKSAPVATVASGAAPLNTLGLGVPSTWSSATGGAAVSAATLGKYTLVDVDLKSPEGQFIAALLNDGFSAAGSAPRKVEGIQRIENLTLWTFYALTRSHIANRNGGNPNERRLFYGDHNMTNIMTVCKLGFDTRVAPDADYGQGLYYNTSPAACDAKCHKEGSTKTVVVCRASCGSYEKGAKGLRRPPPKDPKKPSGDMYDSCVNDKSDPTVFVFFQNTQLYPEFIVRYSA